MTETPVNDQQPTNPQPDPAETGDAPKPEGKTYTEAELSAMVTARLSKQEKALRKQLQDEQAEERKRAEQTAEERVKELERELQQAREAGQAEIQAAKRLAALADKVTHPERVMKLMDDPDEYFDETSPNVEAILEAFPEYKPQPAGPTPTKGAGGNAPTVTRNPWKPETRNLTEQARILRENPALAQQLQRDAAS